MTDNNPMTALNPAGTQSANDISQKKSEASIWGFILIISSAFLCGQGPVICKLSTKGTSIFLFACITLFPSVIIMLYLIRDRIKLLFDKRLFFAFLITGLFGCTAAGLLCLVAVQYTSASNFSIVAMVEIPYSLIAISLFLREKISKVQMVASFLVISGVVITMLTGFKGFNPADMIVLAIPICAQMSHVLIKKVMHIADPTLIAGARIFYGAIGVLAVSIPISGSLYKEILTLNNTTVFNLVIIGILLNAVNMMLWYQGLKRMPLAKATALVLTYPIFTIISAAIFLKERIELNHIVGLSCVITGIYLLYKQKFCLPFDPTSKRSVFKFSLSTILVAGLVLTGLHFNSKTILTSSSNTSTYPITLKIDYPTAVQQIKDPKIPYLTKEQMWDWISDRNHLDSAMVDFERWAVEEPNNADALTAAGYAKIRKARTMFKYLTAHLGLKADEYFDKALKINDKHWAARLIKAAVLSQWPNKSKRDESKKQFDLLIKQQLSSEQKPEFVLTYFYFGMLYIEMNDHEKAKDIWNLGLLLFPNDKKLKDVLDLYH